MPSGLMSQIPRRCDTVRQLVSNALFSFRQDLTYRIGVPFFYAFCSKKAQKSFLFTIQKYYGLTCRLSIAKRDLRSYAGLLFTILAGVFAMHINNIDCL